MRKNFYITIISFSLVSCYTYQVKKPADPAIDSKQESKRNGSPAGSTNPMRAEAATADPRNPNSQSAPVPVNVQEKLASGKNFKINVGGKSYKIIVDRWENDSLVAHPVHNPDKILKFHKNQINSEKIAEKRFSQPIADIITIAVYTGMGVGIWYLLH